MFPCKKKSILHGDVCIIINKGLNSPKDKNKIINSLTNQITIISTYFNVINDFCGNPVNKQTKDHIMAVFCNFLAKMSFLSLFSSSGMNEIE